MASPTRRPIRAEPGRLGADLPVNGPRQDYMRATLSRGADGLPVATPVRVAGFVAGQDHGPRRRAHRPAAASRAAKAGDACRIIAFEATGYLTAIGREPPPVTPIIAGSKLSASRSRKPRSHIYCCRLATVVRVTGQRLQRTEKRNAVVRPNSIMPLSASSAPINRQCGARKISAWP